MPKFLTCALEVMMSQLQFIMVLGGICARSCGLPMKCIVFSLDSVGVHS